MNDIECWYACHKGLKRKINQDNIYLPRELNAVMCPHIEEVQKETVNNSTSSVFAVFDGMGGEEAGEFASYLCTEYMSQFNFNRECDNILEQFCYGANRRVVEYAADNNIFSMGTTAAIIRIDGNIVEACNLGDSRIFRISDNCVEMLSVDHTIGFDKTKKSPLYQYIGIPEEETALTPHTVKKKYYKNDLYLICSDGLSDYVSDIKIKDIVDKYLTTENGGWNIADKMLQEALDNGGKDNISLILLKLN